MMMTGTQPKPDMTTISKMPVWLKQNRTRLQALALLLALGAPFGLYWALESRHDAMSAACFAVSAVSLIVVLVAG
jgi:hypothetical protein